MITTSPRFIAGYSVCFFIQNSLKWSPYNKAEIYNFSQGKNWKFLQIYQQCLIIRWSFQVDRSALFFLLLPF